MQGSSEIEESHAMSITSEAMLAPGRAGTDAPALPLTRKQLWGGSRNFSAAENVQYYTDIRRWKVPVVQDRHILPKLFDAFIN